MFPYTTLFRSFVEARPGRGKLGRSRQDGVLLLSGAAPCLADRRTSDALEDAGDPGPVTEIQEAPDEVVTTVLAGTGPPEDEQFERGGPHAVNELDVDERVEIRSHDGPSTRLFELVGGDDEHALRRQAGRPGRQP